MIRQVLRAAVVGLGLGLHMPALSAKPNIIVVYTDDQTLHDAVKAMPKAQNLLASQGTTFNLHYHSFSLCCPSRASYLTGQYPHNHKVLSNEAPDGGFQGFRDEEHSTLPVWLQSAGYYTAWLGKYFNGYPGSVPASYKPPGWDNWQALWGYPHNIYDYAINDNGTIVQYGTAESDYQPDVLATRAVRTIDAAIAAGKPIFMTISTTAVHGSSKTPLVPAPRHTTVYANEPLPRPPSFNEADVSDKPSFISNLPLLTQTQINHATSFYRRRLGALLAVDDMVGTIVNKLQTKGLLANSAVIFTTDNGFFFGEHRIPSGKIKVYEPSIHAPLYIRGPGFAPGSVVNKVTSNVDLAPTIVALAGATAGRTMDGMNIRQLIGNTAGDTRAVLVETTSYKAVVNKDSNGLSTEALLVSASYTTGVKTMRTMIHTSWKVAMLILPMLRLEQSLLPSWVSCARAQGRTAM